MSTPASSWSSSARPPPQAATAAEAATATGGATATEVTVTYTHLERHGEMAEAMRSAIGNPGPGDTLHRYAEVVQRHATRS